MTNLEWVLENQEQLVKENLFLDRAIAIALGKITLEEVLCWNLSVYLKDQKLVEADGNQIHDKRYIYNSRDVFKWLQAEREEPLEPAYSIGTLIKDSKGNWFFYNGMKDNMHMVVDSQHYVGTNTGVMYYDETFKEIFKPVYSYNVADRYVHLIIAPSFKE